MSSLKGFCHEMNNLNQTQSFSLLLWNYLLILKIHLVTRFKDPKVAILTQKMLTGSRLWFCKIIPKAASDTLILAHFPCSQQEVGTREHRPITKEFLRRVSVSFFKISNFKDANELTFYWPMILMSLWIIDFIGGGMERGRVGGRGPWTLLGH